MDASNLQTASQYVNNLLLSRGLLRDGVAIDFAAPAKGGHDATVADTINLVHDLILRRDRESDHLTFLSQSIQTLRASTSQQAQTIARLEAEKADAQREVSLVKSQNRNTKAELKTLENKNKAFKEDIQRLRGSVGQIRAQCANDIRKRDTEIARLKKHIDVRRTRDSGSNGPGGVTIIDPTTGKGHYPVAAPKEYSRAGENFTSLQQETNEHLTALSAELSATNEALSNLVQNTIMTLRELQGIPEAHHLTSATANTSQAGRPADQSGASRNEPLIRMVETPDISALNERLSSTLSSLRILLTNPSFVPVEEVEVREEELGRLRAGWQTMESRWREAIGMMNGWRQRMIRDEAAAISIDDIQLGMELAEGGLSVAGSPAQRKQGQKRSSNGSVTSQGSELPENSLLPDGQGAADFQIEDREPTPKVKKPRLDKADAGAGLFPAPSVLQPTDGNKRRSPSPRRVEFEYMVNSSHEATPTPAARASENVPESHKSAILSPDIWMEPELTVQQKLADAEASAQEAERVRGAKAEPQSESTTPTKPLKRDAVPRKTKSKRRSTLTPAELDSLMGRR